MGLGFSIHGTWQPCPCLAATGATRVHSSPQLPLETFEVRRNSCTRGEESLQLSGEPASMAEKLLAGQSFRIADRHPKLFFSPTLFPQLTFGTWAWVKFGSFVSVTAFKWHPAGLLSLNLNHLILPCPNAVWQLT